MSNRTRKRLEVLRDGQWLPVFCRDGHTGRVITCATEPGKALPADAIDYFRRHCANDTFRASPGRY